MRYNVFILAMVILLVIPCGHCVEFYTRNSSDSVSKAPDCDAGDVCLFAVVNSSWGGSYDMSYNSHITSCHFADNKSAPTRVCAKGLLSAVVNDDSVDGPCDMNEFGIISFTDNTTFGGHAQIYGGISNYQYHVCVKPRVGCVLRTVVDGCDVDNGEKCVIGLTDKTNAHISDCAASPNPYDFKYLLCCSENNIVCERKKDTGIDYWWDGSTWVISGPDGCSCEFDSQCQSGKCLDYMCVVPAGLVISNLDDVYNFYIGKKETVVFSVGNDMDVAVDASIYLFGVDSRDESDFLPFMWFDGHKSDEFKHSILLNFKAGETKYLRVIIEPAPKSDADSYEVVFKGVSETTGKVVSKTVNFSVDQEYNPDMPFADRTRVPGIGFVGILLILSLGMFLVIYQSKYYN